MTKYEMSVNLPCAIRYEKDTMMFVSECVPLNIMSAGETEEEAVAAIRSAVVMYLQSAVEDGLLGKILTDKGFRFTTNEQQIREAEQVIAIRIQREETKVVPIRVPIGLLAATAARV